MGSYGFRPERHQHKALDAVWVGITRRKVGWVLDADIHGFFDAIDHKWLAKFGLELHPEKTRLLEFGRFAETNRTERGEGKPETFDFPGFTYICAKTWKNHAFTIRRKTIAKRLRAAEVPEERPVTRGTTEKTACDLHTAAGENIEWP